MISEDELEMLTVCVNLAVKNSEKPIDAAGVLGPILTKLKNGILDNGNTNDSD